MEMSSATLDHSLADAEVFCRQVVHWWLKLSPDGFIQLPDPVNLSLLRLIYKKPPVQEMRCAGFLGWGWALCHAITPGIEPAANEASGRFYLLDADPEKQSQLNETLNEQGRGEIETARWTHRMRLLLYPQGVMFRPACVGRGVINLGEGNTAFDNDLAHSLAWLQTDLEMVMDREKYKSLEGLKAYISSESCPLPFFDEECQKEERFWAILQAEGSPIQDFPLHARSFTVADQSSGEENEGIDGRLGCMRPVRYESHKYFSVSGTGAENGKFQIFIKTPTGNTILGWVSANETGESLIDMIERKEGYSRIFFYILHEGSVLHENDRLRERQIVKNATLHVVFRMRGGSTGNRGTAGPSSYKDAARSKGTQSNKDAARSKGPQAEATTNVQPSPYIVEKLESTPVLEIKNPQVKGLFNTLQNKAVICRFNGFWPRSHDLHAWIYQNWTTNCQLLLCSKGFFVVQFESMDDYQKVFLQGPWFWGRAGLFITPWFPEFDANSMVVTKMSVWVRLPNLPLPYWHHQVLEDIGNLLGSFIKSDKERQDKGLFTYARICVEIDLSKGLPDRMHLKHASNIWLQRLDYENTAFRCRYCQLTGHLQDTCPLAKKLSKKKKGMRTNRKNWQADYVPSSDEEEGSEEEEQQEVPREEETMVSDDGKAQTTGNQTTSEDTQINMENRVDALASSKKHTEDSLSDKGIQTALVIHEEAPISGIKRGHESEKSDSDKELPAKQKPEMVNGRQVVVATSSQGRWVEVKNKRKGKKGKIEDYYQS